MKTKWGKIVLINGSALVGAAFSLFIVPRATPFWRWAAIAIATLTILNYVLIRRLGRAPQQITQSTRASWVVIIAGFLLLMADLFLSNLRR